MLIGRQLDARPLVGRELGRSCELGQCGSRGGLFDDSFGGQLDAAARAAGWHSEGISERRARRHPRKRRCRANRRRRRRLPSLREGAAKSRLAEGGEGLLRPQRRWPKSPTTVLSRPAATQAAARGVAARRTSRRRGRSDLIGGALVQLPQLDRWRRRRRPGRECRNRAASSRRSDRARCGRGGSAYSRARVGLPDRTGRRCGRRWPAARRRG